MSRSIGRRALRAYNASMTIGRRLRALTLWIACCAILLGGLAPTLSHAFAADVPDGWVEICSVTGSKLVRIDAGDALGPDAADPSDPGDSRAHALEHCPYCSTHTTVLGLPPAAPAGLILDAREHHVPALFLAAPRTLFAWAIAQSRAPPLKT